MFHHINRFDEKVEIITRYNTDILPTEESAKKMALLIWEIGYKYDLSEFENFTIKSLNENRVWLVQLSTCNKNEKRARCKTYNVVLNKNTSEVLEIWRGKM
ncbi:hypothetical protein IL45_02030 [Nonlabens ulvanivorans]|uniref:Uncharacterized protein n=1 Tax=Nonlabens ulvanivorans TaxID=906888 RepID=A0A084JZN5_NONUL|nr:hypothetical protein IL45_02030 [Nonlabens ulvanivorans]